jgi:hemolysin activation/secretion protein
MSVIALRLWGLIGGAGFWLTGNLAGLAQTPPGLPELGGTPRLPAEALPSEPLPPLPAPETLLPAIAAPETPADPSLEAGETIFFVKTIQVVGSTVFDEKTLNDLTAPYIGREITFSELLTLREALTQLYVDRGYVTSGAYIPPQTLKDNTVTLEVIEGSLEDIVVRGNQRLSQAYISSRIGLAAVSPLNVEDLLAGLQRLQLDPLIETVSADLQAGVQPGSSLLVIDLTEANTFALSVGAQNDRPVSIGGSQRQLGISKGNLLGLGDWASLAYTNTEGSNELDAYYTLPLSPNNDTLTLAGGFSNSRVVDSVFSVLDISSNSQYYQLSYRRPLIETPTQQLAMGLSLYHQANQTRIGLDDIGAFPLSAGADDKGKTRETALRFFQEWTQRDASQVLAVRSQFSLGLDWFNATTNDVGPDSRFFAWRGQGQWLKLLGQDTLFIVRGDVQLATDDLLPMEEFGLGGLYSVRGYQTDALLRDNGAVMSAEFRLPVARVPQIGGLLQVAPFLDVGVAWNHGDNLPGPNTLAGTGLGLLWQQGDRFSARLDWGIPLVDLPSRGDGWQANGLYFSIQYTPF